jgi:hypothetical protein
MALDIFIDESGYTGEQHLDPAQPVFVLSSINLTEEMTSELLARHFTGVQASELKHSRLARRPSGQKRILDFVRSLASMGASNGVPLATLFVAHKKFQLITLLIDLWVEPAIRKDGIDLYKGGANLGLSNMAFCVLSLTPQFLDELLGLFQSMMRKRTRHTYKAFWRFVYRAFDESEDISSDPQIRKMISHVMVYFLGGEMSLGFQHLVKLPVHSLDVAYSTVDLTAHYWDERAGQPLRLTLDESKYFAESKWIWDALTRPDLPKATFDGGEGGLIHYPLNVEATKTSNSKDVRQLQLADILAGAMGELCASRTDLALRSTYSDALVDSGILALSIGGIWPSTDVTPEEMGRAGFSGAHLDYIEAQLQKTRAPR